MFLTITKEFRNSIDFPTKLPQELKKSIGMHGFVQRVYCMAMSALVLMQQINSICIQLLFLTDSLLFFR